LLALVAKKWQKTIFIRTYELSSIEAVQRRDVWCFYKLSHS